MARPRATVSPTEGNPALPWGPRFLFLFDGRGGISTEPKELRQVNSDFGALGASEAIVAMLAKRGIESPFQIQQLVIPEALRGGDVLAKSPTGSGKTLAFAIPIVQLADVDAGQPGALVLVPTRELAAQVTEEIELIAGKKLRVASVYGGVKFGAQIKAAKEAHVIVATPGRLQDLVDRRAISLAHVRILILDEADRM